MASQTRLRLDLNNDGSYDTTFANQSTAALAAGAIETETWSNAWTAVAGTHRFEICADINNNVSESNESNNCLTQTFTVVNPMINSAQCASVSIPSNISPGQEFNATIIMRNNGTTTWTQNNYYLGSENLLNIWGLNRIGLPSLNVAPGSEATFSANFKAPSNEGLRSFNWKMTIDEGALQR